MNAIGKRHGAVRFRDHDFQSSLPYRPLGKMFERALLETILGHHYFRDHLAVAPDY
jgi:hypothetical protein